MTDEPDIVDVEDDEFEEDFPQSPEEAAEMEAEVLRAELEAERAARRAAEDRAKQAEENAERYNPVFDIKDRLFESAEDVSAYFSPEHLREVAQAQLANLNRNRLRRGFDRIDWSDDEWAEQIAKTAAELAEDRNGLVPTQGQLSRVLKMYNPKTSNIVQIPIEDQVNNHKGSLADSIHRYKVKGFKITDPLLCATRDCWTPAEVGPDGKLTLAGYCSEDHRRRTEAGKESADNGVSTRQMINV